MLLSPLKFKMVEHMHDKSANIFDNCNQWFDSLNNRRCTLPNFEKANKPPKKLLSSPNIH